MFCSLLMIPIMYILLSLASPSIITYCSDKILPKVRLNFRACVHNDSSYKPSSSYGLIS